VTSRKNLVLIRSASIPRRHFLFSVLLLRAASYLQETRRKEQTQGLIPVARPPTRPIRFATIAISMFAALNLHERGFACRNIHSAEGYTIGVYHGVFFAGKTERL